MKLMDVSTTMEKSEAKKPDLRVVLIGIAAIILMTGGVLFGISKVQPRSDVSSPSDVPVSGTSDSDLKNNPDSDIATTHTADSDPDLAPTQDSTEHSGAGLAPVPLSEIESLPDSISAKEWDTKRRVQGVEWNTDTMDTVYFSVATYIAACKPDGEVKTEKKTDGYLFSMDYYDGHLFCVWRSGNYGRFKLKVLNPVSLKEENSVNLADMHKAFERDEEEYGGDLCASIDGVAVAPRIGSQDKLMVYVSYNSYISKEDGIARHDQQTIYEYSLEEVLDTDRDNLTAKRRLSVDFGQAEYGIQTLELDRSTGNIWCAIRQGYSDYSLYLIDGQSQGSQLSLIPNGGQSGWDCPEAGDGMCSLGNEQFYLLIPNYYDESVSVETRRVSLDQLEDF